MNVLLIGSGGREHALAWKISQSKKLTKLFIAPGNAGTALCGENVSVSATDFEAIKNFAAHKKIGMVVVGPETPLVKGIHDFFLNDPFLKHIPLIGPKKSGALLEGSKDFAKAFMERHRIPTARYKSFTIETLDEGMKFIEKLPPPYVLKADGLAEGKGVVIAQTSDEARAELNAMLVHSKFGNASAKVVVEEFLKGTELSVFVLTDGISYRVLPEAKDYKRIGEKDTGPNTGGMGAVSPVNFDDTFLEKVEAKVIIPTINGLKKDRIDYTGFIFIGLMNVGGNPFVIEYNCRMGDPETEVILPRIKNDILDLFQAVSDKKLSAKKIEIDKRYVSTVMLVSGGYPGSYEKGKIISGLDSVSDSIVFHAGTRRHENNILTNGGRVVAVTSYGKTMDEALIRSYANAEKISFEKKYYRKDIGFDLKAILT